MSIIPQQPTADWSTNAMYGPGNRDANPASASVGKANVRIASGIITFVTGRATIGNPHFAASSGMAPLAGMTVFDVYWKWSPLRLSTEKTNHYLAQRW